MAAITVTAIEFDSDAVVAKVQFGEAVSLGDSVYLDTVSSNRWKKADANNTEATAGRDGIAISLSTVSGDGRWGVIVKRGKIYINTVGAETKGSQLFVGATPGEIVPNADVASGWFRTSLGTIGTHATTGNEDEFIMDPQVSGQQL